MSEKNPCCRECPDAHAKPSLVSSEVPRTVTTRRRAIAGVGATAAGTVVVTACGSGGKKSSDGPVEIAKTSDVPVGGSFQATKDGVTALITQPTEGEFKAFSTECTHQGCTVQADGSKLTCPCHNSVFSIKDGSPTAGPANSPLPEYTVSVDGQKITVTT